MADTAIANFEMQGNGVGQDTNPQGLFGAVSKSESGQIIATLACDLQDGIILQYSRSR